VSLLIPYAVPTDNFLEI